MNSVNIAGKIVDDPVRSKGSSGVSFTRFKIAVDKNKDNSTNEYDVFEVVVFRDLADLKYEIGQFVGVTGKLQANNYEKDGKSYYNCSIVGNAISMLGN